MIERLIDEKHKLHQRRRDNAVATFPSALGQQIWTTAQGGGSRASARTST